MARAKRVSSRSGRPATSAALRALSLVVALLLGTSSLSQVAHFLLVRHAICAEHGELLELSPSGVATDSAAADDAGHAARANASDIGEGHDHCQLLARTQREQLAALPPGVTLLPAHASTRTLVALVALPRVDRVAHWLFAPKTSPPTALFV